MKGNYEFKSNGRKGRNRRAIVIQKNDYHHPWSIYFVQGDTARVVQLPLTEEDIKATLRRD